MALNEKSAVPNSLIRLPSESDLLLFATPERRNTMSDILAKIAALYLGYGLASFLFTFACLMGMLAITLYERHLKSKQEEFTKREQALIKAVNDERRAQIRQWKEEGARKSFLDDRTAASFDKLEETSSAADQDR